MYRALVHFNSMMKAALVRAIELLVFDCTVVTSVPSLITDFDLISQSRFHLELSVGRGGNHEWAVSSFTDLSNFLSN